MLTLRQALLGCSTGQLRKIVEAWGIRPEPGLLRREMVDLLFDRISSAVADPAIWADLGQDETRVMRRLVRARGHHESGLLTRRLQAGKPADDLAAERIAASVDRLVSLGLVFRIFEADGAVRSTALVLPDEVLGAAETRLATDAPDVRLSVPEEPKEVARCNLPYDLFVLASALRRETWAAASRALAGRRARTVAEVMASLADPETQGPGELDRRWRFLLWVGKRSGWFADRVWPAPDDERVERLLGDRRTAVQEALTAAGPSPREATHDERRPDLGALHVGALQVLGEIESGSWWPVEELARLLAAEVGDVGNDGSPERAERRARQIDDALRRWLGGRWYWLGVVDWGQAGETWSLVAPGESRDGGRAASCGVAGEFQMSASPAADLVLLYRCERYLAYRGTSDGVRRYDLTPASVARGVRLGGDEYELRRLLAALLQSDVPPAWLDAIERWTHAGSALRLEPRVLLVGREASDLDEALSIEEAKRALLERLTDRHALVALDHVADLLAGLATAGQPVEVDAALRVDPRRAGHAASLTGGVVEAAWVALDVLRRLGSAAFGEQRDLVTAIASLEAVLPAATMEQLERRSRTLAALISDRRTTRTSPRTRRRLS